MESLSSIVLKYLGSGVKYIQNSEEILFQGNLCYHAPHRTIWLPKE